MKRIRGYSEVIVIYRDCYYIYLSFVLLCFIVRFVTCVIQRVGTLDCMCRGRHRFKSGGVWRASLCSGYIEVGENPASV